MATARQDGEKTRQQILRAAEKEFSLHGFDAAQMAQIAKRAKVSKQLVRHHFPTKEKLLAEVYERVFRPVIHPESLPADAEDLIAERFLFRAKAPSYIRFLTWEAASPSTRKVPGEEERLQRIEIYGDALREMQADGRLPEELDPRMVQLAIMCLSAYPLSFLRITRLVTGKSGSDPQFQREWADFLRVLGKKMFSS